PCEMSRRLLFPRRDRRVGKIARRSGSPDLRNFFNADLGQARDRCDFAHAAFTTVAVAHPVSQLTRMPAGTVPSIPRPGRPRRPVARSTAMLAEIFIVRLEMQLRVAAANAGTTSSAKRFARITPPRDTNRKR